MKAKTAKADQRAGHADYWTAVERAAYSLQDGIGVLRVSGPGRLDFLQRQTTNDLRLLGPARALTTVLTDPSARILDVLQLVDDGEALLALTLPGNGEKTAAHLQRMIFFMDKVEVADESAEWSVIDLEGPGAVELLQIKDGQSQALDTLEWKTLGEVKLRVWAQRGLTAVMGYRLLVQREFVASVVSALEGADVTRLSEASREILRVEAGMPGAGHELTEAYTPLEANLDWAVSDTKGCYTGQEVIARQLTYDKVTQRLVRLHLEAQVNPGSVVRTEGKKIGLVTSCVLSPRLGPLALAVVKRPYNSDGAKVIVEDGENEIPGRVATIHT